MTKTTFVTNPFSAFLSFFFVFLLLEMVGAAALVFSWVARALIRGGLFERGQDVRGAGRENLACFFLDDADEPIEHGGERPTLFSLVFLSRGFTVHSGDQIDYWSFLRSSS